MVAAEPLRNPVAVGPLRTSVGLADVHYDGLRLRLVVLRGLRDRLDRYRLVLLAAALTTALVTPYAAAPARWVVLGVALLLAVVGLATPRRTGSAREWAESDLHLMDPVHGAVQAHLVLHTATGELRLTGWFWRRGQLDRLQRVLGRER